MSKLHKDNAGYIGVSMEETQDPFWSYNKLALALNQGETVAGSSGGLPIYNTTDAFGTTKGSGTRTDAFASSIVLAVPMDGANGGTTFTDESANIKGSGSAKAISRFGNTSTSTTQAKYYGSSGYFDGTGDYLTYGSSSDYGMGTGDFTLEAWVYATRTGDYQGIISNRPDSSNGLSININNTNVVEFQSGTDTGTSASAIPTNTWVHLAFTRSGTTCRGYVNGALSVQFTSTFDHGTSATFNSGRYYWNSDRYYFQGYLSDVRIYKGAAKYTSNFIVPESGPSTLDLSSSRKVVGNIGATWQTSISKFYGGSANFVGASSNYVTAAQSSDFAFGTSDFTVEMWYYHISGLDRGLFANNSGASAGVNFLVGASGPFRAYIGTSAGNLYDFAVGPTATTWQHLALVRSNGTLTLYVDGSPRGATSWAGVNAGNAATFSVGAAFGNARFANGYIQDVRVYTNIAKYTSSFTPPARSLVQTARRYPSGMHVLS